MPGANAYTSNLLRAYRGLASINQNTTEFYDTYHSIQTAFQRRFQNGFSAGVNYTLGLSLTGNTGLQQRLQHAPDGTISLRADQAQYEELFKDLAMQRHVIKANAVWDLPDFATSGSGAAKRTVGWILNDWQLSGVLTAGSAQNANNQANGRYDLTYSYQNNGGSVNLTGSPDYGARIVYVGDPGSGCSDDQYRQFNTASVTGPTYGSVGLESGRNILGGCPDKTIDLSIARTIRMGGSRQLQFRLDVFNAFNVVVINDRNRNVNFTSPTNLTILNSQTLADGSIDPARLTPRTAGFGAATGAQNMRNMQAMIRFQF